MAVVVAHGARDRPAGATVEPAGGRRGVGRDARRRRAARARSGLSGRLGARGGDRRADRPDRVRRSGRAASAARPSRRRRSDPDAVRVPPWRRPAGLVRRARPRHPRAGRSPGRRDHRVHRRAALSVVGSVHDEVDDAARAARADRVMGSRVLFVGGTSSNAGKSWMATAICAWLRQRGVAVAPFKAQNMSNNSYPCRAGGEIGRAQVAQAEACGLEPEPAMNPILLKPSGNGTSQVVVNGRVWKTLSAREYYAHADELRGTVLDAYEDLASRFDVDRHRRRRQRERAEPARVRSGQPRPRDQDSRAVAAGRRHRARRRVRLGDRHESVC